MNATETLTCQNNSAEEQMLSAIVDAMLDAEQDLQRASVRQWSRILVDSCRRRKGGPDQVPLVTSC